MVFLFGPLCIHGEEVEQQMKFGGESYKFNSP
jgi:hypothetical protein